eukprot:551552-Hanusia_phi.AAC.1
MTLTAAEREELISRYLSTDMQKAPDLMFRSWPIATPKEALAAEEMWQEVKEREIGPEGMGIHMETQGVPGLKHVEFGREGELLSLKAQVAELQGNLAEFDSLVKSLTNEVKELKARSRMQAGRMSAKEKAKEYSATYLRKRVAIKIQSANLSDGTLSNAFVKLTMGHRKAKSKSMSGSVLNFEYVASFEVNDDTSLDIAVKTTRRIGQSVCYGHTRISLDNLQTIDLQSSETEGGVQVELMKLPLKDMHGDYLPCKLYVQILIVSAPCSPFHINVLAGTWNVGNAIPSSDLSSWLLPDKTNRAGLVVIGTQECEYKPRGQQSCHDDFMDSISRCLGTSFSLIKDDSIGQMRMGVWARLEVVAGILGFDSDGEACGLGHVVANKGGVGIGLWVWDTSMVFVASHLAAHQNQTKRRNQDYSEIAGGLKIGRYANCDLFSQFHHVMWMGDLNYRLDFSPEVFGEGANAKTPPKELFDTIEKMVEEQKFEELLVNDQLIKAMEQKEAFLGFQEGRIMHPPTFKVERKLGIHYISERSPAYCDRILWRSFDTLQSDCGNLWCGSNVSSSDHKPVAALLGLQLRPPRPHWWPLRGVKGFTQHRRSSERLHLSLRHGEELPPLQTWKVKFTSLQGFDLQASDVGGKSDPYVLFQGDAVMQPRYTDVKLGTLNPTWSPAGLPELRTCGKKRGEGRGEGRRGEEGRGGERRGIRNEKRLEGDRSEEGRRGERRGEERRGEERRGEN